MCKEFLSIAICAPQKAPQMSFTCGKLHLVAEKRELCDKVTGECLCFLGTCGSIQGISSSKGILFSSVQSIRCVACTSREEEVGDRRSKGELVDSPLLTRATIQSPEEMEEFNSIIKTLWGGKNQCPFHTLSAVKEENAEATNGHASSKDANSASTSPVINPTKDMAEGSISDESGHSSKTPSKGKHDNGLGRKVGIEASIWAEVKEGSPERKHRSPPRFQSPRQRRQSTNRRDGKTPKLVLPQIAAAKSFLGEAKDWG